MTKDEMFELANNILYNMRLSAFEALPEHLKFNKREDLSSSSLLDIEPFQSLPEHLKFNKRADISSFLLLDKICARIPDNNETQSLILFSEDDAVYLSVDVNKIAEVITEEEIHALIVSGIQFSSSEDHLFRYT